MLVYIFFVCFCGKSYIYDMTQVWFVKFYLKNYMAASIMESPYTTETILALCGCFQHIRIFWAISHGNNRTTYTGTEGKCLQIYWWHLWCYSMNQNLCNFIQILFNFCFLWSIWHPICSGLANGLSPKRRQALIWTNNDSIHWHISALSGLNELR